MDKNKCDLKDKKKKIIIGAIVIVLLLLIGIGFKLSSLSGIKGENAKEVSVDKDVISKVDKDSKDKDKTTIGKQDKETDKKDEVASNSSTEKDNKGEVVATSEGNSDSSGSTGGSPSISSKPSSSGGSSSPSKPESTPNKPSTPEHTHSWTPITDLLHHDEVGHWENVVITPTWSEEIPVYEDQARDICNTCNADLTGSDIVSHVKAHMMAGEDKGGHRTEWVQVQVGSNTVNHPAVTDKKWIVDKAAWSETVTNGHSCSCGATK